MSKILLITLVGVGVLIAWGLGFGIILIIAKKLTEKVNSRIKKS